MFALTGSIWNDFMLMLILTCFGIGYVIRTALASDTTKQVVAEKGTDLVVKALGKWFGS